MARMVKFIFNIPEDLKERLEEKAQSLGNISMAAYLRSMVVRAIDDPNEEEPDDPRARIVHHRRKTLPMAESPLLPGRKKAVLKKKKKKSASAAPAESYLIKADDDTAQFDLYKNTSLTRKQMAKFFRAYTSDWQNILDLKNATGLPLPVVSVLAHLADQDEISSEDWL